MTHDIHKEGSDFMSELTFSFLGALLFCNVQKHQGCCKCRAWREITGL